MSFGTRLAEERKRLGLKQAVFAELVGTSVPKQSLYENGRRELRAGYLARLAEIRVDIVYVLTGRRSEGEWLAGRSRELLEAHMSIPVDMQEALEKLARALGARGCGASAPKARSRPHSGRKPAGPPLPDAAPADDE